jgi:hypothetical protein
MYSPETLHWPVKSDLPIPFRSHAVPMPFPCPVAYPGIFFSGGGGEDSTNSTEDRGQRERGCGGSSPLVRGFTQFVIERNPYSD